MKVLNDVTAAPFLVFFSQLSATKNGAAVRRFAYGNNLSINYFV